MTESNKPSVEATFRNTRRKTRLKNHLKKISGLYSKECYLNTQLHNFAAARKRSESLL